QWRALLVPQQQTAGQADQQHEQGGQTRAQKQQTGTLDGYIRSELPFSLMRVQRHLLNYGASRGGHRRCSCHGCLRVWGEAIGAINPDVAGEYPRQTLCPTKLWPISQPGGQLFPGAATMPALDRPPTPFRALTYRSSVASRRFRFTWPTVCPPLSGHLECRDAKRPRTPPRFAQRRS